MEVAPGQDHEQHPVPSEVFPGLLLDPVRLGHQQLIAGVSLFGAQAGRKGAMVSEASGIWTVSWPLADRCSANSS